MQQAKPQRLYIYAGEVSRRIVRPELGDAFACRHWDANSRVPVDFVEAYAYYNLGVGIGGHKSFAKLRDDIASRELTRPLVVVAQQRSREIEAEIAAIANGGKVENSPDTADRPKATGSGFVITLGGIVATNWHVVSDATRIELVTSNGIVAAEVIASDRENDLALLKAEGPFESALPVSPSRGVGLGTEVFTIGFPNPVLQGFSPKYNRGEVSSLAGPSDSPRFFQISVPVQPGNSGGALCDSRGRVVGVVTAKLSQAAALESSGMLPENVNYAIKSTYLLALMESIPSSDCDVVVEQSPSDPAEAVLKRVQQCSVLVRVF